MKLPNKKDLDILRDQHAPICLSFYLRLNSTPPSSFYANAIKIGNIIREARKILELRKQTLSNPIGDILQPIQELLENDISLWQGGAKGVAVFISDKLTRCFLLPEEVPEITVQAKSFYIRPLENILEQANETFYILSLSHEHASLYRTDKYTLEPVKPKGLPTEGVMKTLRIDELPFSLQLHPLNVGKPGAGKRGALQQFHGQYNKKETNKLMLVSYFRKVDEAVCNYLNDKKLPLVFAGVKSLFPLYKSVNSYQYLQERPIEGNYDNMPEHELHKRALALNANWQG